MQNTSENTAAAIPDKLYFRVGEVSRIAGVEAHVLRFWESEFSQIRPKRTSSGQRLYRKKDVETILDIKDLLYRQKYTIPGARQHLKNRTLIAPTMSLSEIREALLAIRRLLE
ncbi:MAG: MerR family transcriptional regulator [Pseudomonadota bacterium]